MYIVNFFNCNVKKVIILFMGVGKIKFCVCVKLGLFELCLILM